ncbi:MAG TPA: SPOR domain-containing protein [Pyrinomonadaceae bacterium]|nr:SPOR domain-containing protein [Pyrinomonadaceae bacterium]
MATDTHRYASRADNEARHSALEEFSRDERRPAVLLLSALVIAVLFFTIGLLFGRWTAQPSATSTQSTVTPATAHAEPSPQTTSSSSANSSGETSSDSNRRFTLLVATFDTEEKAQSLIKTLQQAGYADVRLTRPRAGETRASYSVLIGHFTQTDARAEAQRMNSSNDQRLKNAKVIEEQ